MGYRPWDCGDDRFRNRYFDYQQAGIGSFDWSVSVPLAKRVFDVNACLPSIMFSRQCNAVDDFAGKRDAYDPVVFTSVVFAYKYLLFWQFRPKIVGGAHYAAFAIQYFETLRLKNRVKTRNQA